MQLTSAQKQAQQLIDHLIKTCWEHPEFKKQLITSPVETIEKVTGRPNQLPKECRIKVEDQTDDSFIYLNIPPKPNSVNKNEQLERPHPNAFKV